MPVGWIAVMSLQFSVACVVPMKPFIILLISAIVSVVGALWFGETLARHYPDGGLWVFLPYFAVHVVGLVITWALVSLSIPDEKA